MSPSNVVLSASFAFACLPFRFFAARTQGLRLAGFIARCVAFVGFLVSEPAGSDVGTPGFRTRFGV